MANKYDGEVSIRLDKVRTLRYNVNAFADYAETTGEELFDALKGSGGGISFSKMRMLLWAGLKHEMPNLTPSDAGELAEQAEGDDMPSRMQYVMGRVMDGIVATMGEDAKKKYRESREKMEARERESEDAKTEEASGTGTK